MLLLFVLNHIRMKKPLLLYYPNLMNSLLLIVMFLFLLQRYYHNITSNTLVVLESMAAHDVKTLIYSSTCATYGEPEKMPITEDTPQVMAERLDYMLTSQCDLLNLNFNSCLENFRITCLDSA